MSLFWLNDSQWQTIVGLLPTKQTGPKRSNDRVVISGIVHVLLSGCSWRDCPSDYGPYMTVFNRFNRWKHSGVWHRIATALTSEGANPPVLMPDGTPLAETVVARSRMTNYTKNNAAGIQLHRAMTDQRKSFPALAHRGPRNEWTSAADELRKLASAHEGQPASEWLDEIVEWHLDSMFTKDEQNSAPDAAQRLPLARLASEITDLRLRVLSVLKCLQHYTEDPVTNASATKARLRMLIEELSRPGDYKFDARAS